MKLFELKSIAELETIAKTHADLSVRELAIREIAKRENSRQSRWSRRLQPHHYGLSTFLHA